jgi:hypothetical protein
MWEAAISGAKRISIREGHRDYRVNETLMVCCHIRDSAFMATLTGVRHCRLNEVTEEEYLADGFKSQAELLSGLQAFYPNMTMDSAVTVLRWGDARGTSVARYALC